MIGSDDPRLTAYVVDEVDLETAEAIRQAIQDSDALQEATGEIRGTAQLLSAALANESVPTLHPEQRRAIESAAHGGVFASSDGSRRWATWAGLAAAVVLVLGALLLWPTRARNTRKTALASPQAISPGMPPPDARLASRPESQPTPPPPVPAKPPRSPALPRPTAAPVRSAVPSWVTLQGVVKDETGAIVRGATIAVRSLSTGATRQVASGPAGRFRLDGLRPEPLELKLELPGFKTVQQNVSPSPGAVVAWNPTARVGTLAETIMVEAETPRLETRSSSTTAVIHETRASALPLNDSGFAQLSMAPGLVGAEDIREPSQPFNTEAYAHRIDNDYLEVARNPLSTFSVDVDTASYANVRRLLNDDELPTPDAVRIEEMVNYFPYDYPPPGGKNAFAVHTELAPAPWRKEHRLLRIGIKAREIPRAERPSSNLVFLIDVSGSMDEPAKLPLVQSALGMLVDQLTARDRVAIVVYAGAAGLVLPPTSGDQRAVLRGAIDRLSAGGSTNGGEGIQLAYDLAARHFIRGGVNRVILATDGDFNVGIADEGSLVRLIEAKAKSGVFLSVLGFGMGNYKDSTLEMLADKGNGNYAYVDTLNEARKLLAEEMASTLITVAKDVKIQVEFNPTKVKAYRLIGYENRLLRAEEFNDDAKDAGDVGAGHGVTALYEIVPAEGTWSAPTVDPLTYQKPGGLTAAARSEELLRLKLRYKEPEGQKSRLKEWPVLDRARELQETSADYRFAAAVAEFGLLLRESPHKGEATIGGVRALAGEGLGADRYGYRAEFIGLVEKAERLLAGDRAQKEGER